MEQDRQVRDPEQAEARVEVADRAEWEDRVQDRAETVYAQAAEQK
jgi:hypothetical protein